ncbi:hypothetical protein DM01DRAFT_1332192 [Hesseltinella vesiculosa]|uniref:Uncharacterized protein n=1 Tax=Hesseltinella vesiculosa TaxID=101127 RepID=A0A1X2GU89_9FUNG|nr:hypothetical protein DM01DRAFT_1332192 [Hesseltinella vesiculosa]
MAMSTEPQDDDEITARLQKTHLKPPNPNQSPSQPTTHAIFGVSMQPSDQLANQVAGMNVTKQDQPCWSSSLPTRAQLPWEDASQGPVDTLFSIPSWQQPSNAGHIKQADDNWGDAPSYTSILPNTEFGFTSTILPSSPASSIPASDDSATVKLDPAQPFSRFLNQQVHFPT